jgi:hypothetical protein
LVSSMGWRPARHFCFVCPRIFDPAVRREAAPPRVNFWFEGTLVSSMSWRPARHFCFVCPRIFDPAVRREAAPPRVNFWFEGTLVSSMSWRPARHFCFVCPRIFDPAVRRGAAPPRVNFWFEGTLVSSMGWRPARLVMRAIKPIEQLVLVSFMHCCTSTPSLSTWSSSTALKGILVLRWVSRLDAFSGYPFRT